MRALFRTFLVFYLRWAAKLVVLRHRPTVIVVSGSTRKTATKEKLADLLSTTGSVRKNPRSYNTEVGVPLAILDLPSGDSSYLRWLGTVIRAPFRALSFRYPKVLVLEFGVSSPGDMRQLTKIVKPNMVIFTTIEALSDDAVADAQATQAEQLVLLKSLPDDGTAVINQADPLLVDLAKEAPGPVVTYSAQGGSEAFAAAAAAAGAEAIRRTT